MKTLLLLLVLLSTFSCAKPKAIEDEGCAKPEDCAQGLTCAADNTCQTPDTIRCRRPGNLNASPPDLAPCSFWGMCRGMTEGRCKADKEADCRASGMCKKWGQCKLVGDHCG